MFHFKKATMKFPRYQAAKASNMDKSSANVADVEPRVLHIKASPVKEPIPIKPQSPPAGVTTVLFSLNNNTRPVHNKENSTNREHNRTLDEALEDSGYLSLHNSQIDDHHREEEGDQKTITPNNSPSKCQGRTNSSCPVSLVAASTPVDRPRRRRRTATYSLSSTPTDDHSGPNLPILKFQQAVCEELAKSYRKNKRYDWSIVTKVAEDHFLEQVIGGHMGLESIDMFTSLLSRNMKNILTNILSLLGDMDLISCKKVSKTWRDIIYEDELALSRCARAEEALRESKSSLRQSGCGLTRDTALSRVVLSGMQTLASSRTATSSSFSSSSSALSCKVSRRTAHSKMDSTPSSQCTRFKDYIQAASSLKQHESLRSCKRCGSPATHSPEMQRATCTRRNCLFDFCTCCQETFHGSSPCRTVTPRSVALSSKSTQILPGSARSKRNIRRL